MSQNANFPILIFDLSCTIRISVIGIHFCWVGRRESVETVHQAVVRVKIPQNSCKVQTLLFHEISVLFKEQSANVSSITHLGNLLSGCAAQKDIYWLYVSRMKVYANFLNLSIYFQ